MPKRSKTSRGPAPAPIHTLTSHKRSVAKKASCGHACSSCMPMGETQIIALLLVAVFGLASVLTAAVISLNQQKEEVSAAQNVLSTYHE